MGSTVTVGTTVGVFVRSKHLNQGGVNSLYNLIGRLVDHLICCCCGRKTPIWISHSGAENVPFTYKQKLVLTMISTLTLAALCAHTYSTSLTQGNSVRLLLKSLSTYSWFGWLTENVTHILGRLTFVGFGLQKVEADAGEAELFLRKFSGYFFQPPRGMRYLPAEEVESVNEAQAMRAP